MTLFMYFIIYSFLGWCTEVIFYVFKTKSFVNRGFLNGPFIPIYGFSMIAIHRILFSLFDSFSPLNFKIIIMVFFVFVFISTLFELIGGSLLYYFFETRWWDYSKNKLNFKGFICLELSLIWGLMGTIFFFIVHINFTIPLVSKIPNNLLDYIVYSIIIYLIIDLIFTVKSLINFKSLIKELKSNTQLFNKNFIKTRNKLPQSIILQVNNFKNSVSKNDQMFYVKEQIDQLKLKIENMKDKISLIEFDKLRKISQKITETRLYKAFPKMRIPFINKNNLSDNDE